MAERVRPGGRGWFPILVNDKPAKLDDVGVLPLTGLRPEATTTRPKRTRFPCDAGRARSEQKWRSGRTLGFAPGGAEENVFNRALSETL
jgi:hypothetical protein